MTERDHQLALVTSFYEDVWNKADDIALTRLLADDFHFKGSTELAVRQGREAFRGYRDLILSRLANYRCRILDVTFADRGASISFDDGSFGPSVGTGTPHCVARVQFSGAHVTPFQAPPLNTFDATGTELSWLGVAYFFFSDETPHKIQALWVMGDVATIYAQLSAAASTKLV